MNIEQTQDVVSKKEIDLIKSIFKGNDELLLSMRALLLGLGITEEEKTTIKTTFANEEVFRMISRRFNPQISKNTPIGTVGDDWLGTTQMVFGQNKDTIKQAISYKRDALAMVKKALILLQNPEAEPISVVYHSENDDELGIGLLTRNQYIQFVESQLLSLKTIANIEEETVVEQAKRIMKDSSK